MSDKWIKLSTKPPMQLVQRWKSPAIALGAALLLAFPSSAVARSTADLQALQSIDAACGVARDPGDLGRLYEQDLVLDIYRNGSQVGQHTVSFEEDGDATIVRTTFDIEITFLFVTAYSFNYESVDRWRNGCLESMTARTTEDGETTTVTAAREGDRIKVIGPAGTFWAAGNIIPTNHYDPRVLDADQVLNTISGKINDVRIVARGEGPVAGEEGSDPARHYKYTGELTNEVWYDDHNRWVGMRFAGKDGSTIELRCTSCGDWSTAQR